MLGILAASAWNKKGQKRFQPIGGAAELTEAGRDYAVKCWGAENIHISKEGMFDARFEADDTHLEDVMAFFGERNPEFSEIDPVREIRDELCKDELNGIPPVLSAEEVEEIDVEFLETKRQPFSDGPGTSDLAKEGVPSRRLFNLFEICMPQRLINKMLASEAIRSLTAAEISTTEGGRHKGATSDGIELADNFVW
jgi:hypothetical protein